MNGPVPYLRFEGQALEAASFYAKRFSSGGVRDVLLARAPQSGSGQQKPRSKPVLVEFELEGTRLVAENAASGFRFEESAVAAVGFDAAHDLLASDRFLSLWTALAFEGRALLEPNLDAEDGACGVVADRYGNLWCVAWGDLGAVFPKPVLPFLPLPPAADAAEAAVFYGRALSLPAVADETGGPLVSLSCGQETALHPVDGTSLLLLAGADLLGGKPAASPSFLLRRPTAAALDQVRERLEAAPLPEEPRWVVDRYGARWLLLEDGEAPPVGQPRPASF